MYPATRVLGFPPDDGRLLIRRSTNTVFPITRFRSREEAERRREELRFNLRMAAGLYPWPEKTPLHPVCEDVGDFDGYSVKKIRFETFPGLWSTGNLYLPRPLQEPAPAILNVIGHWEPQRLTRTEAADYPRQLANFAKMGFVCLVTDMIGKVDSRQLSHEYGRGTKELWLSNGLGIQLWNNIRALDLLESMPEVDGTRIGMTGASGGGSQTLFLAFLDERVRAAAPINMISLLMQGGCQCENAPGLRRETDNAEMCALIAPRALFLAGSDGDWTRFLETAELPAVLEGYRQFGAEGMVEHFYQIAPHQYNAKTRARVYGFFARHLMGKEIRWEEQPIEPPDIDALRWYHGDERAPGFGGDEEFFAFHRAERTAAISALPEEARLRMLRWMTGVRPEKWNLIPVSSESGNGVAAERLVLDGERGEKLPFVVLTPDHWDGRRVCLILDGEGKPEADDPEVRALLASGVRVVSGDCFLTGEFRDAARSRLGNPGDAQYDSTFVYTDEAYRIGDAVLFAEAARSFGAELTLRARGRAARTAACALPLIGGVGEADLDGDILELPDDEAYLREFFVPGIRLLGGIEGCLKLAKNVRIR